jgi:hypothetical protein
MAKPVTAQQARAIQEGAPADSVLDDDQLGVPPLLVVIVEEPSDLVADALIWAWEFAERVAGLRGVEVRAELADEAQALLECCAAAAVQRVEQLAACCRDEGDEAVLSCE